MVNKGVASWLLKDHLDKTALGAGQVEGLAAATFRIATFKGVGALLKNSVELGSDDVKGTPRLGPAASTQMRTRSPTRALRGSKTYWLA